MIAHHQSLGESAERENEAAPSAEAYLLTPSDVDSSILDKFRSFLSVTPYHPSHLSDLVSTRLIFNQDRRDRESARPEGDKMTDSRTLSIPTPREGASMLFPLLTLSPLSTLSIFSRLKSAVPIRRLEDEEDEQLMLRFVRGEEEAFAVLSGRLERPLFFYLYRILKNKEQAEDVLQDTFLRMIQHAQRYKPEAKLRAWAYKIAKNRALDLLRRKDRNQPSLDAPLAHEGAFCLLDLLTGESEEGSQERDRHEMRARILKAVDELPPLQREVFLLREVDGMKFREIAALKEVSENTIKSRMRYALESLRHHLHDYAEHYQQDTTEILGKEVQSG